MTVLKICGMRRPEDLDICRRADYLGFVVHADSPRELELSTAHDLMSVCGNRRVAVTTERDIGALERLVQRLEPDVLQLHVPLNKELLQQVTDLAVPVWGMLTVRHDKLVDEDCLKFCQALVLDSPGVRPGGNGTVHDWDLSRRVRNELAPFPVVLAGGLRAENVIEAIARVAPFAVDVSSGAEGITGKDPDKVDRLIDAVRRADGS